MVEIVHHAVSERPTGIWSCWWIEWRPRYFQGVMSYWDNIYGHAIVSMKPEDHQ